LKIERHTLTHSSVSKADSSPNPVSGPTFEGEQRVSRVSRSAHLLVFSFYLLVFFAGCGDRTPIIEVEGKNGDPLKENMINANRIVAQSETTQIKAYLERHGWEASPLPCGAWYEVTSRGEGKAIAPDDRVVVTYRLEALDGTPFYTHQVDTLTVGRREQTLALDEVLQRMEYHGKARIIAPSGAAYGVTGDGDRVGSRTVIVYHIEDLDKLKIEN